MKFRQQCVNKYVLLVGFNTFHSSRKVTRRKVSLQKHEKWLRDFSEVAGSFFKLEVISNAVNSNMGQKNTSLVVMVFFPSSTWPNLHPSGKSLGEDLSPYCVGMSVGDYLDYTNWSGRPLPTQCGHTIFVGGTVDWIEKRGEPNTSQNVCQHAFSLCSWLPVADWLRIRPSWLTPQWQTVTRNCGIK